MIQEELEALEAWAAGEQERLTDLWNAHLDAGIKWDGECPDPADYSDDTEGRNKYEEDLSEWECNGPDDDCGLNWGNLPIKGKVVKDMSGGEIWEGEGGHPSGVRYTHCVKTSRGEYTITEMYCDGAGEGVAIDVGVEVIK